MTKNFISLVMVGFMVILMYPVRATEIALEQTTIPEGAFSILLYKPQRSELPLREKDSGVVIVTYTYQSYFPAFDVSYVANFSDWSLSKQYEIDKYGSPLMRVGDDIEMNIRGVQAVMQQRLHLSVKLLESREINYGKYPGRDATFEFSASGSRYIIRHRVYEIDFKEYSQQVIYPAQYERYVRPETFLDSFKLEPNTLK